MGKRLILLGLLATWLLPLLLLGSVAPLAGGWLPTIAPAAAQTGVTITLSRVGGSIPLDEINCFEVQYTDAGSGQPAQACVYSQLTNVKPGTQVTISAKSIGSSQNDEWCFAIDSNGNCQQIQFTPTSDTVLCYYELLSFQVTYSVFGGGAPLGGPQLTYTTAPTSPGCSPVSYTIPVPQLPASPAQIWALRDTQITVPKTLPGSTTTARWATNITSWTVGASVPPPPGNIAYYYQYLVSVSPSVVYGSVSTGNPVGVVYSAYGGVGTSTLSGQGTVWVDAGGALGWVAATGGSNQNTQYSATLFTYGLAGYWPMSEGSGGYVFDLSGNGNRGQIFGLPVWVQGNPCLLGACLAFDGSQYVLARSNSIPFGNSAFTKAVWVYLPNGLGAAEENSVLLCWGAALFAGSQNCLVTGGGPNQLANTFGGNLGISWTSTHIVKGWNLIVVTYNGTLVDAYVNGALEASKPVQNLNVQPSQVYIGGGLVGYSNFGHPMQEVRVYSYAWSQNQVSQYYSATKPRLEALVTSPSQSFAATYYAELRETTWYTVVGGGNPSAPTISFYMLGQQFSQTLGTKPQDIWMDAGAAFSVPAAISGGSAERWATNQTAFSPPTTNRLHLYYFHQYQLSVSYQVVGGGAGYGSPIFGYVSLGKAQSATLGAAALQVWADASSGWSVSPQLPGSTDTERWQVGQGSSGTVGGPATLAFTYYHQFYVAFGYTVVGGGSGYSAPTVSYVALGTSGSTQASAAVWVDAGTTYVYSNPLAGSGPNERWYTASASGVVSGPGSVEPAYYHQYLLTVSYSVVGGGSPPAPRLNVTQLGSATSVVLGAPTSQVWADSGTGYALQQALGGQQNERWASPSPIQGSVDSAKTVEATYYHQFYVEIRPNVEGAGTVSPASGWYDAGQTITVSAQASAGWMFEGWAGTGAASYSGGQAQQAITVSSPIVEVAVFYAGLTVSVQTGGSVEYSYGSTTGSLGGGTHTIYVAPGTQVSLSEKPTPILYVAKGFTYGAQTLPSDTTIAVNGPVTVAAQFAPNYAAIVVIVVVVAAVVAVVVGVLRARSRPRPT